MFIPVIGAGSIGRRHHENLEMLGARTVLLPWRAFDARAFKGLGADALVIATATQVRLELVKLAADLDIPFYVEKPLAFDPATLDEIHRASAGLSHRSMVGLMMRYHPAFRHLARCDLGSVYDISFGIGHDVRQWRKNWSFAESYASRSEGGGVLLDLCHELDMALTLFPGATPSSVTCLGHEGFPGVDFSTQIGLLGPSFQGHVEMDYLSAASFRRIILRGTDLSVDFDLISGRYAIDRGRGTEVLDLPFQRNDMFLAAMRDFLHLVDGSSVSDVEHLPRLDRVTVSSRAIADAWEARRFVGLIKGSYA